MNTIRFGASFAPAAFAAIVLSACGGGGGDNSTTVAADTAVPSASTLAQDTSTVSGTVTGFGSVIVDGVRIDDHLVTAGKDQEDGTTKNVELKLGQHLEVMHDGNLLATAIKVVSAVEGMVSRVDAGAGSLIVLNQTVTVNTDPALGPVTIFSQPYAQLSDIKAGDSIEVHGSLTTDSSGRAAVQATRIEKAAAPAFRRLRGHITELSASSHTFKIGDLLVSYASATIMPAKATIDNSGEVVVSIPAGAVMVSGALPAQRVVVNDRKANAAGKAAHLAGPVSKLDPATKTFTVDQIKVDASKAKFAKDDKAAAFADLKPGSYIVLKGAFNTDGSVMASAVVLRGKPGDTTGAVELHGTIQNYVSNANFEVRDVVVDASKAVTKCSTALGNNTQVEVWGHLSATGKVSATAVNCEKPVDGKTVIERKGAVSKVDTAAKTMVVGNTATDTVNVKWTDKTLFVGVDAAGLNGKTVKVHGIMSNGVLLALKIKLSN